MGTLAINLVHVLARPGSTLRGRFLLEHVECGWVELSLHFTPVSPALVTRALHCLRAVTLTRLDPVARVAAFVPSGPGAGSGTLGSLPSLGSSGSGSVSVVPGGGVAGTLPGLVAGSVAEAAGSGFSLLLEPRLFRLEGEPALATVTDPPPALVAALSARKADAAVATAAAAEAAAAVPAGSPGLVTDESVVGPLPVLPKGRRVGGSVPPSTPFPPFTVPASPAPALGREGTGPAGMRTPSTSDRSIDGLSTASGSAGAAAPPAAAAGAPTPATGRAASAPTAHPSSSSSAAAAPPVSAASSGPRVFESSERFTLSRPPSAALTDGGLATASSGEAVDPYAGSDVVDAVLIAAGAAGTLLPAAFATPATAAGGGSSNGGRGGPSSGVGMVLEVTIHSARGFGSVVAAAAAGVGEEGAPSTSMMSAPRTPAHGRRSDVSAVSSDGRSTPSAAYRSSSASAAAAGVTPSVFRGPAAADAGSATPAQQAGSSSASAGGKASERVYVKLTVESARLQTKKSAKSATPQWHELFIVPIADPAHAALALRLKAADHLFSRNTELASLALPLATLLRCTRPVECWLPFEHGSGEVLVSLFLRGQEE